MAGSRQPPRLEPTIAPLEQSPIYAHRTGAGEPTLAPEPAPRPDVRQDVRPDAARPQGNPARPFGSTSPLGGTGRPMGNPGSLGASRPLGNTAGPADRGFGAARPFGGAVEPPGAPFLGGSAHLARPPEHGLQAPYAADPAATRGRRHAEPAPEGRTEFQRDRDRIVHANAFRRLEYKTQVFINHEGDLFRTRLTHTLEVAQIARSVARTLRLNEDLTEAISLAHDLGHTPFGHAGQDELNACMMAHAPQAGGFEHNMQSLRVVDALEERYAAFDGLNLCFETREGILKHCSAANARKLGDLGVRFLERTQPSLEAQLANLSDEIAYNNHDIDDGLRSGLITLAQMRDVPIFARHYAMVERAYPDLPERRAITETIRRMINTLIVDLTRTTAERIASHSVRSADDVRAAPMLVAFSDGVRTEADQLKKFLMDNLYRHYKVMRVMNKAKRVVRELFEAFLQEPRLLPPAYQRKNGGDEQARAIADYIAGMTDRYAIREHRRLFMVGEDA